MVRQPTLHGGQYSYVPLGRHVVVQLVLLFSRTKRVCDGSAGSRSSSPLRSAASSRLVQSPPDVAAVQRPGSSLGMRSKTQTHRVAQSQGCSRETSPERFAGANNVMNSQSELEAAVADALVRA